MSSRKYYDSSDDESSRSKSRSQSHDYSRSDSHNYSRSKSQDDSKSKSRSDSSSESRSPVQSPVKKPAKKEKKPRKKSAYFFFCDKQRKKIMKEHPQWKLPQVSKELGKQWRELDARKKRRFVKMAEEQ